MTELSKTVLENLKKGNQAAFKELFDFFYERLYAFSFKYVKNNYAAEEITANTMLFLWEKRANISNIKDIKPYLYKVTRNASLDYLKNKDKVVRLDFNSVSLLYFDKYIIEEEVHAILLKAIENLPSKCKRVFELCCIEGVKYKDVAEDLNISINTVKSQRRRALALLKNQFKDNPLFLFILKGLLKVS
ncbi:RNA polymerase sigma factor [Polaribacter cellanae]|uniref:RNA polymerase sigma-70 factor n=1 Tax=Polaribacter cellanae TaxID=2818493 RepID=A0A975H5F3_9FLAO|nr:RNA polymerase sigma-70 factor [Polaribacter cellanae]QTE21332.1 RNA polymerase sigma-70 factor [Polaribacter cellanae]